MSERAVQATDAAAHSPSPTVTATPPPPWLSSESERRALRAARYAAAAYPGAVGEVIAGMIQAYVQDGHALSPAALAPRLVSAMQRAEVQHPLPPLRSASGNLLAARYITGSQMHWRHPTAADEPEVWPYE